MAAKGARVHIYGDWDGTGVKRAQQDIGMFGKQAAGFSGAFSKSMLGAGAALGGAFAVTSIMSNTLEFLKDAAGAAMEDEKSAVSLAKAMENLGLAHSTAGVEKFVKDLMLATGVADDQLRPAYQKLVTATGDVSKAQDLLTLSMDIATATQKDLGAVSQAMARASLGQVSALTRLGVPLDANIIKTKDFAAAQQVLTDKFGGQAAAAAETYAGKMARVTAAVDEAKETIGYALLNALDSSSEAMGGPDGFVEIISTAGDVAAMFVTGIGGMVTGLADLAAAAKKAAGSEKSDGVNALVEGILRYGTTAASAIPGIGAFISGTLAVGIAATGVGNNIMKAREHMDALRESTAANDVTLPIFSRNLVVNTDAAADAATAMEDLKAATDAYLGAISLSQAIDDFEQDLATIDEALKGNALSFKGRGEAAKENRDLLRSLLADDAANAKTWAEQTGASADELTARMKQGRKDIIDAFVKQGFTRKEIKAFLGAEGIWGQSIKDTVDAGSAAAAAAAKKAGEDLGKALALGIPVGLIGQAPAVGAAAARLIGLAKEAAEHEAGIESPSKVWAEMGRDLGAGLGVGIDASEGVVATASAGLAKIATTAARKVIDEATASAMGAVESSLSSMAALSQGVVSQVMGNLNFSTENPDGTPMTPEQMMQAMFGDIVAQRQVATAVAASIGGQLPPALLDQILGMDPAAAIALANYLAANPQQLEQLKINYAALAEVTKKILGEPMGQAWGMVGDESAAAMLAGAIAYLEDHKGAFKRWVRENLSTTVQVTVDFVRGSGGGVDGQRANGGPVSAGGSYLVGERGPEIITMGNSGGFVTPNSALGGGNSYTINLSATPGTDRRRLGQELVESIRAFEKANGNVWAAA